MCLADVITGVEDPLIAFSFPFGSFATNGTLECGSVSITPAVPCGRSIGDIPGTPNPNFRPEVGMPVPLGAEYADLFAPGLAGIMSFPTIGSGPSGNLSSSSTGETGDGGSSSSCSSALAALSSFGPSTPTILG
jgi:hypothetical protein